MLCYRYRLAAGRFVLAGDIVETHTAGPRIVFRREGKGSRTAASSPRRRLPSWQGDTVDKGCVGGWMTGSQCRFWVVRGVFTVPFPPGMAGSGYRRFSM